MVFSSIFYCYFLSIQGMGGGSFEYQLAGQLHEGRARIGAVGRKYSDESSASSIGIAAEPQSAMYSMEMAGQLMEGHEKLRRMHRYASETSIDYEERAGEWKGGKEE
jgi:hypothetical protein